MYRTSSMAMLGLLSGTLFLFGGQLLELGGRQALAQSPKEKKAVEKTEGTAADDEPSTSIVERLTDTWTCAMHPHVRQGGPGKCPICAMELLRAPARVLDHQHLVGIDVMTARAVRESPEVRAAEARLRVAEAELQQARWQALQRIIALRRERRRQQAELQAAEAELREAERAAASDKDKGKWRRLVDSARQRVQRLRQELAETDALLSFAAGNRPAAALDVQKRAVIQKELLPKAQAALKMATEAYQVGELDLDELLTWSQRVAELKRKLARTPAEKRAALEAQREMLQEFHDLAQARYRAAQTPVTDVLAIEYRIAELKLESLDRGEF